MQSQGIDLCRIRRVRHFCHDMKVLKHSASLIIICEVVVVKLESSDNLSFFSSFYGAGNMMQDFPYPNSFPHYCGYCPLIDVVLLLCCRCVGASLTTP